jgi:hypothetical protein
MEKTAALMTEPSGMLPGASVEVASVEGLAEPTRRALAARPSVARRTFFMNKAAWI